MRIAVGVLLLAAIVSCAQVGASVSVVKPECVQVSIPVGYYVYRCIDEHAVCYVYQATGISCVPRAK